RLTPRCRGPALLAEQLLDLLLVGGGDHHVVREASGLTRAALLELVHVAGPLAHDLPGPGNPEPLLGTGVRLVLRHSSLSSSLPGCSQPAVLAAPGPKAQVHRRRCCVRAAYFFLFGPSTIVMFRPSWRGRLST